MTIPFERIKNHYEFLTPFIIEHSKPPKRWIDPYFGMDWSLHFTPIEEMTWMSIRSFGKIPLYPQYPVGKYFIDFGNPVLKIGIECDGKEWHTDLEKDYKRDKSLANEKWKIFRVSGSDCNRVVDEYYDRYEDKDEREVEEILLKYYRTVDGLLKALAIFYFNHKDYSFFQIEMPIAIKCIEYYVSEPCRKLVMDWVHQGYGLAWEEYEQYNYQNGIYE